MRTLHTPLKNLAISWQIAKLSFKHTIEVIDMFLGPFDTGGHHDHGKAGLVYQSRVLYNGEVDEGHLVDVEMKIALEDALSSNVVSIQFRFVGNNITYLTRFLIISLLASR